MKKYYLQYNVGKGDKITLLFRNEESMSDHINKYKISKFKVHNENPFSRNEGRLASAFTGYVSYIHTTRRGISG